MSNYELVYIVSPDVTEEALPSVVNRVNEFITKTGGSVSEVTKWGRKKLAYPIKRFAEGNYVLARLEIKPTATRELEANLKLSSEVIRHLLISSNV